MPACSACSPVYQFHASYLDSIVEPENALHFNILCTLIFQNKTQQNNNATEVERSGSSLEQNASEFIWMIVSFNASLAPQR